ncbi:hypothetical protein AAFF_G00301790 [Aldrovandia affinis]|uniref:Uncharacterized protein n=1 Tax=Aldrovandia affinis TaxID=143900 RepID=A0AAD7WRR2_9TELE|nr:hypothetical protein AAFF_G00301790 [Aldrovandia affinis]
MSCGCRAGCRGPDCSPGQSWKHTCHPPDGGVGRGHKPWEEPWPKSPSGTEQHQRFQADMWKMITDPVCSGHSLLLSKLLTVKEPGHDITAPLHDICTGGVRVCFG